MENKTRLGRVSLPQRIFPIRTTRVSITTLRFQNLQAMKIKITDKTIRQNLHKIIVERISKGRGYPTKKMITQDSCGRITLSTIPPASHRMEKHPFFLGIAPRKSRRSRTEEDGRGRSWSHTKERGGGKGRLLLWPKSLRGVLGFSFDSSIILIPT